MELLFSIAVCCLLAVCYLLHLRVKVLEQKMSALFIRCELDESQFDE